MSHKRTAIALASMSLLAPIALASPSTPDALNNDPVTSAIVIYASRFEESAANALPQTHIISDQEIRKSGLSNVSAILQKIGGLITKQNLDGSSNSAIDMRGFGDSSDNNVVVLLDGIRLSENEQAAARTSLIPVEAIDHIEITRGGNSVLYGDGATGGTINIVTKSNLDDLTVATAGVASYSTLQSSIFHARKNDDVSLTFFARQLDSAGYRDNANSAERSIGFSSTKHLSATDAIGLRMTVSNENNKLPGALPMSYLDSSPRSAQVPGYASRARTNTSNTTLFGSFNLRKDVQFKVDLNHATRSNDWNYNYDASTVYSGYNPSLHPGQSPYAWGDTSASSHTTSLNPRFKFEDIIVPGGNLIVGHDWTEYKKSSQAYKTNSDSHYYSSNLTSTNINDGSYGSKSFKTNANYIRSELPLSKVETVVLGARNQSYRQTSQASYYNGGNTASCNPSYYCSPSTDSYESSGQATAYEAQYTRSLQDNLKAYARASRNFRFANLDDNAQAPYAQSHNLNVQRSRDYEAGMTFQGNQVQSTVIAYVSHLKDEIGFNGSNNINFDPTKREGLELRGRYTIDPKISLNASLNLSESKFTSGQYSGKTVPGTSTTTGYIGAQYQLSAKERLGWQTRFSSKAFASGDMDNTQIQRAGFDVSDLSYTYSENKWQIIGSINNIFNKHYTDSAIYKSAYEPLYRMTVYPNPGRNIGVMGRYSF